MAQLVSAKSILIGYDPESPTDEEGKKYRGTAHEFQDYAYRLACDLNDLDHLNVYMSLAKKYPRYILDEVYSYIADVNEHNKGRLFMWKLKQVNKEIQTKMDLSNTEYEHVYKKMKDLYNKFSEVIYKKDENLSNNNIANMISLYGDNNVPNNAKILFLGCNSSSIPLSMVLDKRKIFGLNVSQKITKIIKGKLQHVRGTKFISKDFFKNTYKDLFFDLIVIDKYWLMTPLEKENDFLREIYRISKNESEIILVSKIGEEGNNWKNFEVGSEVNHFFEKVNDEGKLKERFRSSNFKIKNQIAKNSLMSFILTKNQ